MKQWYLFFTSFFICTSELVSAGPGDVVINEIGWMGTSASSSADEWLELFNPTSSSINITNWTLSSTDETPAILLSGTIPAMGYFLLERTDETTVNDISADQIYTGSMENGGENLELRDDGSQLIDQVNCGSGWFAGSSSTYSSMERVDPLASGNTSGNWGTNDGITRNGLAYDNNPINGTPKAQNSVFASSLAVSLSGFHAIQSTDKVTLHWTTESEVNSVGFNIYRAEKKSGPFTLMNSVLISSQGNSSARQTYSWEDVNVMSGSSYWYRLEEVDQSGIKTSLDEIHVIVSENKLPEKSELLPNYPNPFNPDTVIRYGIADGQDYVRVRVDVYNVTGQCVRHLVNRFEAPGLYAVQWDGLGEHFQVLAGGIYICRLVIDGMLHDSVKMMKVE